jgi:hypothetical protein
MSDESKKRRRARIVVWTAVALLVLYPVSVGPVKLIGWHLDGYHRGAWTRFFEDAYRPITNAGHRTGLSWLVNLYVDTWLSLAPTHFD